MRADAHLQREIGAYQRALEHYAAAERQFDALGLEAEVARTGAGHVWTLRLLGRYDEALRLALRTLRFFRARRDLLEVGKQNINLGAVYRGMGRLTAARRAYQEAIRSFHACDSRTDEATTYTNLGNVLADLGRYDEAERAQRRAARLYRQLGQTAQVARAQLNLGLLLKRRGDFGRALTALEESRALYDRLGLASGIALADLDLAQTYLALNLQQEAVEAGQRARVGLAALGLPVELGQALLWSAAASERSGDAATATALLAEAEELFHEHGNRLWEQVAIVLRASLAPDEDSHAKLAEAGRVLSRLGARDRAIEARLIHADLFTWQGETKQALAGYRAAERALGRLGDDQLAYRVNRSIAHLLEQRQPARALRRYLQAMERLEHLRSRARADDLKVAFVADKLDVYERAVALQVARRRRPAAEEAFALVERGKSVGLLEDLLTRPTSPSRGAAERIEALRERQRLLQQAYADRENGGAGTAADRTVRELEREISGLTRDLHLELRSEVLIQPLDLATLRSRLPANALLLEYYSLGQELVCFVVDREQIRLRRGLASLAEVNRLVERLRFQLGKGVYGADYLESHRATLRQQFDRVLRDVWQLLLAPLGADLRGPSELVVVPHGPLHGLPLHAALDGDAYLCEQAIVSYAPSARVFATCAAREPEPLSRPLFVAPRDGNLPWISQEVEELAGLFPQSQKLAGRQASVAGLRRRAGQFDLLHLAAHGTFRADNPAFSALRLADGWLSVADLAELSRDTQLVTLSACETARSGVTAGDDLVGLTRSVLGAGAASVLASLWSVHDQSTGYFMTEYYRQLRAGQGKAVSLQAAMRSTRATYEHPYFWAPFVLSGAR